MRNLNRLDIYRQTDARTLSVFGSIGDHENGVFLIPSNIDGKTMVVIASRGGGWEHVSVSRKNRCPNWGEMGFIKELFFDDTETVMQLHVPKSRHVNFHSYALHLWRPTDTTIPTPPSWMVGPRAGQSEAEARAEADRDLDAKGTVLAEDKGQAAT